MIVLTFLVFLQVREKLKSNKSFKFLPLYLKLENFGTQRLEKLRPNYFLGIRINNEQVEKLIFFYFNHTHHLIGLSES